MKLNYESIVVGNFYHTNETAEQPNTKKNKCILVPYRPQHVVPYHTWMSPQNDGGIDLLQATASEPLSLEEEYEMQQSWYLDDSKCTFIILSRNELERIYRDYNISRPVLSKPDDNNDDSDDDDDDDEWLERLIQYCNTEHDHGCRPIHLGNEPRHERTTTDQSDNDFVAQSLSAMVGDVNLFLSEYTHDNDDDEIDTRHFVTEHPPDNDTVLLQGEIDIMIAVPSARNQGYGYEAVLLMMLYGAIHIPPHHSLSTTTGRPCRMVRYYCKIHESNVASQYLFTNKLHFVQCRYTECFQEYEYEFCCDTSNNNHNMWETIRSKLLTHMSTSPTVPQSNTDTESSTSSCNPLVSLSTSLPISCDSSFIRIIPCPLSSTTRTTE